MKNNFVAVYPDSCEIRSYVIKYLITCSGRLASFRESGGSKRKLGRALLCLPFALQMGFCVSSGDTLPRFRLCSKRKQDTRQYPAYRNKGIAA